MRADSGQIIKQQKEVDFNTQINLKSTKTVFLQLNGKLYVTSGFGERYHPVYHKEIFHGGIDLRADHEMVYSIANGIIANEGYDLRAGIISLFNIETELKASIAI